jgi:hypothetical protein
MHYHAALALNLGFPLDSVSNFPSDPSSTDGDVYFASSLESLLCSSTPALKSRWEIESWVNTSAGSTSRSRANLLPELHESPIVLLAVAGRENRAKKTDRSEHLTKTTQHSLFHP